MSTHIEMPNDSGNDNLMRQEEREHMKKTPFELMMESSTSWAELTARNAEYRERLREMAGGRMTGEEEAAAREEEALIKALEKSWELFCRSVGATEIPDIRAELAKRAVGPSP
jgi:hypothetical protein